MKGTIHKCAEKLVCEKFGLDKWEEILVASGLEDDHVFMMNDDVDEKLTGKIFQSCCDVLGIHMNQLFDAFGDYWARIYTPTVYPAYYENIKSAREFLLNLDQLHVEVTNTIPNARPPRFLYENDEGNGVIMQYKSARGMLPLFISIAKGLCLYYNDPMEYTVNEETQTVHFIFQGS